MRQVVDRTANKLYGAAELIADGVADAKIDEIADELGSPRRRWTTTSAATRSLSFLLNCMLELITGRVANAVVSRHGKGTAEVAVEAQLKVMLVESSRAPGPRGRPGRATCLPEPAIALASRVPPAHRGPAQRRCLRCRPSPGGRSGGPWHGHLRRHHRRRLSAAVQGLSDTSGRRSPPRRSGHLRDLLLAGLEPRLGRHHA